jgi:phosphoribosylamine--glycine ligase
VSASKTVLVLGSGGRESAIAWRLSLSPQVARVICAPGNDSFPWERWPIGVAPSDFDRLIARSKAEKVDLIVVGPDNPLADGVVDQMTAAGLEVFGPTRGASKLEWSKAFAKEVMKAAGVPTAEYFVAQTNAEAQKILKQVPWPKGGGWVIKADGLALGKGVRVCSTHEEAVAAAEELIGVSGSLVIEEKLSGVEATWMAICDGKTAVLLEPARDHKRLGDADQGPNTGGMGAYSPVPGLNQNWAQAIHSQVFVPMLAEMSKRGIPFKGVLYAGLMVDLERKKFWIIEFNSRFGDPEAQVILARLDADLYELCWRSARGELARGKSGMQIVPFVKEAALVVIAAAPGYPESPKKGIPIHGVPIDKGELAGRVFWAGAAASDDGWMTSGGRVFGALGMGESFEAARTQAYERASRLKFEGMHFRKDIGAGLNSKPEYLEGSWQ